MQPPHRRIEARHVDRNNELPFVTETLHIQVIMVKYMTAVAMAGLDWKTVESLSEAALELYPFIASTYLQISLQIGSILVVCKDA